MTQASAQRLSYRIAAESLLLSEEKWILEALKKIKTQRNCLQIERLQLESMRSKLRATEKESCAGECILPTSLEESVSNSNFSNSSMYMDPTPSTSTVSTTVNLMQTQGKITSSHIIEYEPNLSQVEEFCNEEALNLEVTNPLFTNMNTDYNMEENEEDDEEPENVTIDMDMLMNGTNMDD